MITPKPLIRSILQQVVPYTVLALLVVICVSRWFAAHVIETQVIRKLELASTLKTSQLTHELNDLRAAVRSLAENPLIRHALVSSQQREQQLPALFQSLELRNAAFYRITMTDYAGRPIVSSGDTQPIDVSPYLDAVTRGLNVTRLSADRIIIACPIEFGSADFATTEGILATEYDLQQFLDRFRGTNRSDRYRVFLNDRLVYSDHPETDFEDNSQWLRVLSSVPTESALHVEQSERRDAAFASLRSLDWFLVGVFIFCLAAIGVTTWLATRIVARPLDALVAQMGHIEHCHELSQQAVPVEGPLEIQKLTTSFNLMIQAIADSTVSRNELERTQNQLKLAVNSGNIGLWNWNIANNEVELSPELSAQVGETTVNIPLLDFIKRLHPEDVAATRRSFQDCHDGHSDVLDVTFRLRHRDGTFRWIMSRARVAHSEHGMPLYMTGVHVDITERFEAQNKLQFANKNLARSNEELAQFAYVASHDLQEPLRKVLSFARLLEDESGNKLTDDSRMFLGHIVDGAQRMRTLIQDLLAYSRVESDGCKLTPVESGVSLADALHDLDLVIQESGAEIDYDDLPRVLGDQQQLKQLFQNLISNAIKYCDQTPRIKIGANLTGSHYEFSVRDNGIGIAPAYRNKVFGIFKRLHGRGTYAGNGIGLAICRRIVSRLNGTIWVRENSPKGSCFVFTLPASRSTAPMVACGLPIAALQHDLLPVDS